MFKSQSNEIEELFEDYLNNGMTNVDEIYSKIVSELNVPRPTVRRVKKEYLARLESFCTILRQPQINTTDKNAPNSTILNLNRTIIVKAT